MIPAPARLQSRGGRAGRQQWQDEQSVRGGHWAAASSERAAGSAAGSAAQHGTAQHGAARAATARLSGPGKSWKMKASARMPQITLRMGA